MCRCVPCVCMQKPEPDIRCCPLPCAAWSLTEPEAHISARLFGQWALRIHQSLSSKSWGYRFAQLCLPFCPATEGSLSNPFACKASAAAHWTISPVPWEATGLSISEYSAKHKNMKSFEICLKCLVLTFDFEQLKINGMCTIKSSVLRVRGEFIVCGILLEYRSIHQLQLWVFKIPPHINKQPLGDTTSPTNIYWSSVKCFDFNDTLYKNLLIRYFFFPYCSQSRSHPSFLTYWPLSY